jgi:probable phosphoglycerate mutase
MELILLRHAQPQWYTAEGLGASDPPLTEEGRRRSRELGASLGAQSFQSILVSPHRRSQETARGVFEGRPEVIWQSPEWLREIRLPDLSEQPAEQIDKFFGGFKQRPLVDWWDGIPGGESFRDFHARVASGLEGYLGQLGIRRMRPDTEQDKHLFVIPSEVLGSRHLVISHLGTTGLILSELLHMELVPWVWESFALDWNGVVRLETVSIADGHLFCLRVFNESGHRDPSLGHHVDVGVEYGS